MYWEYSRGAFWQLTPGSPPVGSCKQTRQWQVYGKSDWQVITEHYPGMIPPPVLPPPRPQLPCPICAQPPANRWLLYLQGQDVQADGYLIKAGAARALHEGVPYLKGPSLPALDPLGSSVFYPPHELEIVGGGAGDVARITLASPAGRILQAIQPLNGPAGRSVLVPHPPAWYLRPTAAVPIVDVMPLLSSNPAALTGLLITAVNPLPSTTTVVGRDAISATLFEAGRGYGDVLRHPATSLTQTGGLHEGYAGTLDLNAPVLRRPSILSGSLYLTPRTIRHEDPAKPGEGAWALASYSISCNSPSDFLGGHAPSDEGGIDSSDGVVNVHLTGAGLQDLCVGFTAQVGIPLRPRLHALSAVYAIHGSVPQARGRAVVTFPLPDGRTVITFHYDPALIAGGGSPGIVRSPLPSFIAQSSGTIGPTCLLPASAVDRTSDTVAALVPRSVIPDGVYEAVLVSPALMRSLPRCAGKGRLDTLRQIRAKGAQ
jgi:hypothetical protein